MKCGEEGRALILVYEDGTLVDQLTHAFDGGERYMAPVIRRGIAYAKTNYNSGDIVKVLLAEPEMVIVRNEDLYAYSINDMVRHVYYVGYECDYVNEKKTYSVKAMHPCDKITKDLFPNKFSEIPAKASTLI